MSKFKGVLFDLDGTLLDTANDLGEALNFVLSQHNLPTVAREKYRPVASDGAKGLLELGFKDKLSQYDYEALRKEFLNYYQKNIAVHTCLYSGINDLIAYLDENNIPWGIVTNKPINLTNALLPSFTELSNAQSILGGDSLPQRKPHPAPLLQAAKEIGVAPSDCIYVGDAPRDIEAGNRANMFTVIAKWGYIENLNEIDEWLANIKIDHPIALKAHVL
ncbi:HAD-IA family hydrolase [Thalassotalea sp. M1531]|uniref:HAD-IA family hydrolase n=1 Tax=Thalassotalea algicola TaxID=2716224 RepID=A0A7Y0LC49_9GAMM|nr:HAD-IA family hydrolase [Thalassotalea algicola]NMP31392.1 HAD-IA family hydrolase [Thalassotalea algicola]